jgi:hypothetical protein
MTTKFASQTWRGSLRVSSAFGAIDAAHSTPHSGVDIVTAGACLAPFDGVVTRDLSQGNSGGGLGNYFQMVSHDGRFVFTVGHGNSNSDTGLRRGARITAGTGIMRDFGRPTTGRSTGPHYHEQLTDNGRLVDLLKYLGKSWGAESAPVSEPGGWDGVSTLYKGNYVDDGLVYTIHVGETIWGVATSKGLTLDQVRAWTAALAGSKYGPSQLAKSGPGASWWDGSGTYYAGCTFAVADVVARFAAEDAKVAAAQQEAAEQAEQAAAEALAAVAEATASGAEIDPPSATETVWAETDAKVEAAAKAAREAEAELAAAVERARAVLPSIDAATGKALEGDSGGQGALSGLFSGNDTGRKRAYLIYAGAALLVSFGPDIVTANVLADNVVPSFVAYVSLASSILLKIGTALGFVAASNTAK